MSRLSAFDFKSSISKSLNEVFEQMLGLRVEPTTVVTKSDLLSIKMIASVSFAGTLVGSLRFQVGDKMARIITAAMLGMDVAKVENGEDIYDVVREIINIISGNLNYAFSKAGFQCDLTVPSLTVGDHFGIKTLNVTRHERFAFRHDTHTMFIEVYAKEADPREVNEFQKKKAEKIKRLTKPQTPSSLKTSSPSASKSDIASPENLKSFFHTTMSQIFDTMLDLPVVFPQKSATPFTEGIVAEVGIAGDAVGFVSIHLKTAMARSFTRAMLGYEAEEEPEEDEIEDVVSEMSNMLGGNLKSKLMDAGYPCKLSVPSVTNGSDFSIKTSGQDKNLLFPFSHNQQTGYVTIHTELCSTQNETKTCQ